MEETLIADLVNKYMAIGIGAILVGCSIWLIKHYVKQQTEDRKVFVKQQTEDRATIMGLFQNELKDLHKDSSLNAELNRKSVDMLKTLLDKFTSLIEYLNHHFNGNSDKVHFEKEIKIRK
jgi:hypothetical protein